jgi:hypothetical protein
VGHVVVDAHREVVAGRLSREVVEHRLHHRLQIGLPARQMACPGISSTLKLNYGANVSHADSKRR